MDHSTIWIGRILFVSGTFVPRTEGKGQFHCRAVCNVQKMPVRLFNSIFFLLLFLFPPFDQSCEIEKPLMMDVI